VDCSGKVWCTSYNADLFMRECRLELGWKVLLPIVLRSVMD